MNSPKISIIVPVYKIEKYINKCIDTILLQTFTDFECILVDDCSPDNCPKICDEYAEKDNRIKVIHKEQNGGLPQGRKTGLDMSSGEYILYVDGDDWIESDMLNKMYTRAIYTGSDMVICDIFTNIGDKQKKDELPELYDKLSIIKNIVVYGQFGTSVCNKLIRRDIYKNIFFPTHNYIEDRVITIQTIYYAQSVEYINDALYHYRKNEYSICGSSTRDEKTLDEYHNFIIITDFLAEKELLGHLMPELITRINTIKVSFLKSKELRKSSETIFHNLYPQSTKKIFSKENKIILPDKIIIFLVIRKFFFIYTLIDICLFLILILKNTYRLLLPKRARNFIWNRRYKNPYCERSF